MKESGFSKEQYLKWFEDMLLMRRFEERCGMLYGQQKIKGFLHLYIGQEAVVAGAMSVLTAVDNMITAYRDHAHAIAKGTSPRAVMAELYGKDTGCSKGKGGSMHMFDFKHRFFGGHGIVGGQIPMGAGIAFAEQYRGTKNVTLCYMGDGAVRQGAFHEALNMAMTWTLPVIFIVENNFYAMGTSVARTSNVTNLYKLGAAYDMPSEEVNGMSVEVVHDAMDKAVQRARDGKGPTLLEMVTYRYKGHSMSDPAKYRKKEELESYKEKDPVEIILKTIREKNFANDSHIEEIEKRVKDIVDDAVHFAEESPYPDASELYKDVYVQEDYPFITE